MKRTLKVLSLVFAIALLVAAFSVSVFAADYKQAAETITVEKADGTIVTVETGKDIVLNKGDKFTYNGITIEHKYENAEKLVTKYVYNALKAEDTTTALTKENDRYALGHYSVKTADAKRNGNDIQYGDAWYTDAELIAGVNFEYTPYDNGDAGFRLNVTPSDKVKDLNKVVHVNCGTDCDHVGNNIVDLIVRLPGNEEVDPNLWYCKSAVYGDTLVAPATLTVQYDKTTKVYNGEKQYFSFKIVDQNGNEFDIKNVTVDGSHVDNKDATGYYGVEATNYLFEFKYEGTDVNYVQGPIYAEGVDPTTVTDHGITLAIDPYDLKDATVSVTKDDKVLDLSEDKKVETVYDGSTQKLYVTIKDKDGNDITEFVYKLSSLNTADGATKDIGVTALSWDNDAKKFYVENQNASVIGITFTPNTNLVNATLNFAWNLQKYTDENKIEGLTFTVGNTWVYEGYKGYNATTNLGYGTGLKATDAKKLTATSVGSGLASLNSEDAVVKYYKWDETKNEWVDWTPANDVEARLEQPVNAGKYKVTAQITDRGNTVESNVAEAEFTITSADISVLGIEIGAKQMSAVHYNGKERTVYGRLDAQLPKEVVAKSEVFSAKLLKGSQEVTSTVTFDNNFKPEEVTWTAEISPAVIVVTTAGTDKDNKELFSSTKPISKIYDGVALTNDTYELKVWDDEKAKCVDAFVYFEHLYERGTNESTSDFKKRVLADIISVTVTGSITEITAENRHGGETHMKDAGKVANDASATITEKYEGLVEVSYELGYLWIEPVKVAVQIVNNDITYDGKPHTISISVKSVKPVLGAFAAGETVGLAVNPDGVTATYPVNAWVGSTTAYEIRNYFHGAPIQYAVDATKDIVVEASKINDATHDTSLCYVIDWNHRDTSVVDKNEIDTDRCIKIVPAEIKVTVPNFEIEYGTELKNFKYTDLLFNGVAYETYLENKGLTLITDYHYSVKDWEDNIFNASFYNEKTGKYENASSGYALDFADKKYNFTTDVYDLRASSTLYEIGYDDVTDQYYYLDIPRTYEDGEVMTSSYEPHYIVFESESGVTTIGGKYNILKRPVTIDINDITVPYGTAKAAVEAKYAYTVVNALEEDEDAIIQTINYVGANYEDGAAVGEYVIKATYGEAAPNYVYIVENGTLKVTKIPVYVKLNDATVTYGEDTDKITFAGDTYTFYTDKLGTTVASGDPLTVLKGFVKDADAETDGDQSALKLTTTYAKNMNVDEYKVGFEVTDAGKALNYEFLPVLDAEDKNASEGKLTVNPLAITVVLKNDIKVPFGTKEADALAKGEFTVYAKGVDQKKENVLAINNLFNITYKLDAYVAEVAKDYILTADCKLVTSKAAANYTLSAEDVVAGKVTVEKANFKDSDNIFEATDGTGLKYDDTLKTLLDVTKAESSVGATFKYTVKYAEPGEAKDKAKVYDKLENVLLTGAVKIKAKEAGTYYITVVASKDNYNDQKWERTITIADTERVATFKTDAVYNGKNQIPVLNTLTINGVKIDITKGEAKLTAITKGDKTFDVAVGATEADTYTLTYDITRPSALKAEDAWKITEVTLKWTIAPFEIKDVNWPKDNKFVFGQTVKYVPTAVGVNNEELTLEWDYAEEGDTASVGGHSIVITGVKDSTNYEVAENAFIGYIEITPNVNVKFSNASVVIGKNYAVNFKVPVMALEQYAGMFTVVLVMNGDAEVYYNLDGVEQKNGSYIFTYDNINPDQMADTITAMLYIGDEVVHEYEYSVATYCYNQLLNIGKTDPEFAKLLVSMLRYGAAVQMKTNPDLEPGQLITAKLTGDVAGEYRYLPFNENKTHQDEYKSNLKVTDEKGLLAGVNVKVNLTNGIFVTYTVRAKEAGEYTFTCGGVSTTATLEANQPKSVQVNVNLYDCANNAATDLTVTNKDGETATIAYTVADYAARADVSVKNVAERLVDFSTHLKAWLLKTGQITK